jgi:hypothetical protein
MNVATEDQKDTWHTPELIEVSPILNSAGELADRPPEFYEPLSEDEVRSLERIERMTNEKLAEAAGGPVASKFLGECSHCGEDFYLRGNINPSADTLTFASGLKVSLDAAKFADYKFNELKNIGEIIDYVKATYSGHYVGKKNVQTLELIESAGHAMGFCIGDILKYAARQGKKKGEERKDILKIIHYGLLLLHFHDEQEKNKETT